MGGWPGAYGWALGMVGGSHMQRMDTAIVVMVSLV